MISSFIQPEGYFLRAPTPPEWHRFLAAAARVRHLELSYSSNDELSDWQALALCRPQMLLFPNLRSLHILDTIDNDEMVASVAHLCLGPKSPPFTVEALALDTRDAPFLSLTRAQDSNICTWASFRGILAQIARLIGARAGWGCCLA